MVEKIVEMDDASEALFSGMCKYLQLFQRWTHSPTRDWTSVARTSVERRTGPRKRYRRVNPRLQFLNERELLRTQRNDESRDVPIGYNVGLACRPEIQCLRLRIGQPAGWSPCSSRFALGTLRAGSALRGSMLIFNSRASLMLIASGLRAV